MPRRVRVDNLVITGVAVSVQGLGVIGSLDNRIRREEFAEDGIVEPGAVIVEAALVFLVGGGVRALGERSAGGSGSAG